MLGASLLQAIGFSVQVVLESLIKKYSLIVGLAVFDCGGGGVWWKYDTTSQYNHLVPANQGG